MKMADLLQRKYAMKFRILGVVVTALLVFFVRFLLEPVLGSEAPLLLFLLAVIISAWLGSTTLGIVMTFATGILGNYFFIQPSFSLSAHSNIDLIRLAIYLFEGIVICIVIGITKESQRTTELSLEREKIAKREAERANMAKEEFVCNMSHELRTPLTSIQGYLDLMSSSTSLEEVATYIGILRKNSQSLCDLVNDVLDLGKIDSDKVELHLADFSIELLLNEVVEMFTTLARKRSIELTLSIGENLPAYMRSDRGRFRQILVNILGNAIKFTEKGTVKVSVCQIETEVESVKFIRVLVEDSGIGLSKAQQSRLFERFQQGDASTTRKFGGSGLGLVLSKRLAKVLQGDVNLLESTFSKGSKFEILIPWVEPLSIPVRNEVANQDKQPVIKGLRILLVDDAEDNRVLFERLLKREGAVVATACDGFEGVDMALKAEFDFVLMDVQMPRLDGIAATRSLRNFGYSKPIFALTAHAMETERKRCLEAGFNEHLSKPLSMGRLIEAIQKMRVNKLTEQHSL